VTYTGEVIPERTSLANGTDPQICGATMVKDDVVISPTTRGIRHVLVWLEDVTLPAGYRPPPDHVVVDNVGCQFVPHAAVATVGSTLEARSSDPVLHTTHLHGAASANLALPTKGSSASTTLRGPGLIKVLCDKHGWMEAFIRVDPHPYHAVTDADGKFAIAGVPGGTYKLKVWHERFLGQEHAVTVEAGTTARLDVQYAAP
jgi:plastocyanin